MSRRKAVNVTGISRIEGIPNHEAWIAYKCVKCMEMNYIRIGLKLLTPSEAFDKAVWTCENCGYIHSKDSDLPFKNWDEEYLESEAITTERFWKGFFRTAITF